jgi:hypothetical protein
MSPQSRRRGDRVDLRLGKPQWGYLRWGSDRAALTATVESMATRIAMTRQAPHSCLPDGHGRTVDRGQPLGAMAVEHTGTATTANGHRSGPAGVDWPEAAGRSGSPVDAASTGSRWFDSDPRPGSGHRVWSRSVLTFPAGGHRCDRYRVVCAAYECVHGHVLWIRSARRSGER